MTTRDVVDNTAVYILHLACDADEEVDHGVGVLLLYRFGEQRLSARH